MFKKALLPILITGIWINISETFRWMLWIESYWLDKYQSLNIVFPNEPINMVVWMIWGFLYGYLIYRLIQKFSVLSTAVMAWFMLFVMMWIVVWNIGVLPTEMLWFNAPLAFIEAFIGAWICKKLNG